MRPTFALGALALLAASCQSYPFEPRYAKRSEVKRIDEVVLTTRPTDILLVVDNSGTMEGKRELLVNNISSFVDTLIDSATDFHLGIVTTDVDCNLPSQSCSGPNAASDACCTLHARANLWCTETRDGSGKLQSNCDGGRLRADAAGNRIFTRPVEGRKATAAEKLAWTTNLTDVIQKLACDFSTSPGVPPGSAYQSGLEAALRAVGCSMGQCPANTPDAAAVAELNAGFVRTDADPAKNADLVVMFLTGTDDCSFRSPSVYRNVNTDNDPAKHLCDFSECYASYGTSLDTDGDGKPDWWDETSANNAFSCSGFRRSVAPPMPNPVDDYLTDLVNLKGGDARKVRGAAIVSGLPDASFGVGFKPGACYESGGHPSTECSCLFTHAKPPGGGVDVFCQLTTLLGQFASPPGNLNTAHFPIPAGSYEVCKQSAPDQGGCQALPGTRYTEFLKQLAARHVAVKAPEDVLIDSLCQQSYSDTLSNIVNNIILRNCFDMGMVPKDAESIQVSLNGNTLPNVAKGAKNTPGWSWVPGASEICLEGLTKSIADRFEIFVASPQ
jgi:hypothetical protein